MKRIIIFFFLFILLAVPMDNAYSVETDGYDSGNEWFGADSRVVLNGESNCKVNFGIMKWLIDSETNTVYFCIMFKEPELLSDNKNIGISLQVENSDPFYITVNSTPNEIDADKYYFDGAISVDENNGATCEIRLGMKYGIPQNINGNVRFYDSEGTPSNIYDFIIENTESTTVKHNNSHSGGTYHTTANNKTTTSKAEKTTKPAEKTTKKETTDSDNSLWLLDLLLSEETTKNNSKTTTKADKSESKVPQKKSKSTKTATNKNETTKKSTELSTSDSLIESTENASLKNSYTDVLSLEKGDKYKTITLIAGGISLVAISVLGSLKSRKDSVNDNDPKS